MQQRISTGGSGQEALAAGSTAEAVRRHLACPSERARLVRLCAQLTWDREAAEDLAQETLVEAWRHADRLRSQEAWQQWLSGIARNVCLRWQRRAAREMARLAPTQGGAGARPEEDETPPILERAASETVDFEGILERAELADLLDRAMDYLPPQTGKLLVQRYVDDLPAAEIAARLGTTENATAVRLHRGKRALKGVLTTRLRAEAAAHGLVDAHAPEGHETRIWCPACGGRRLWGRFDPAAADTWRAPRFKTWCPGCGPDIGGDFGSGHPALNAAAVLGDVQAYKPALNRVHAWWNQHYRRLVAEGQITCSACGRRSPIRTEAPPGVEPILRMHGGIYLVCLYCRRRHGYVGAHGLALMLPETQRFWRRHPRMRCVATRHGARFEGQPALILGFEAVSERASLEVTFHRDTYAVLQIIERPILS